MCKGSPASSGKKLVPLYGDDFKNADLDAEALEQAEQQYVFKFEWLAPYFKRMLKDERNLPMAHFYSNILLMHFPVVAAVFATHLLVESKVICFLSGLLYWLYVTRLNMVGRFHVMYHTHNHRPLYHNECLNMALRWLCIPFFGLPPGGWYVSHHVMMHHRQLNDADDASSTIEYQRDEFAALVAYCAKFLLYPVFSVQYAFKIGRYAAGAHVAAAFIGYYAAIAYLAVSVSFGLAWWVFIGPNLICTIGSAYENWVQHIFIDPKRPTVNSWNIIEKSGGLYFRGYHAVHHKNSGIHWTGVAKYFDDNRQDYADSGYPTFRGLHVERLGRLVFRKQFREIAEHYVHIGKKETTPTIEEVEQMLRERVNPMKLGSK